jgi:hypothetical protein
MLDLLLELVFYVIVEGAFELLSQAFSTELRPKVRPGVLSKILAGIAWFGVGSISGLLLTVFFPYRFIRITPFPGFSLLVIPVLAALTMVGIGRLRVWQGQPLVRLDRFAYAYIFAFGMALARLLLVV